MRYRLFCRVVNRENISKCGSPASFLRFRGMRAYWQIKKSSLYRISRYIRLKIRFQMCIFPPCGMSRMESKSIIHIFFFCQEKQGITPPLPHASCFWFHSSKKRCAWKRYTFFWLSLSFWNSVIPGRRCFLRMTVGMLRYSSSNVSNAPGAWVWVIKYSFLWLLAILLGYYKIIFIFVNICMVMIQKVEWFFAKKATTHKNFTFLTFCV